MYFRYSGEVPQERRRPVFDETEHEEGHQVAEHRRQRPYRHLLLARRDHHLVHLEGSESHGSLHQRQQPT